MDDIKLLSTSTLAFVGDAVYSLLVRTYLASKNRPSGTLHDMAVEFVKAPSQAKAMKKIESFLSEEEIAIFKRGRNLHTSNTPKSSSNADYHTATGLECLFGFLHLSGNSKRIEELFSIIIKDA
ncbi:MAG: ribonuclease III [Clostridia bacterium]|nr:ribonuclease III [Clostridia bacterium]